MGILNPKSKITIEHGVVIVATGAEELKPNEYLYGEDKRVITQLDMEEQIANSKSKIRGNDPMCRLS